MRFGHSFPRVIVREQDMTGKICILYDFQFEMDFSHHESPNPTRVIYKDYSIVI